MKLQIDTIDLILLSCIYGGLLFLPIFYRRFPFPWKSVLMGIIIAAVFEIFLRLLNLLTLQLFHKKIGGSGEWDPLRFFFVNVPLLILLVLFYAYRDLAKKESQSGQTEK